MQQPQYACRSIFKAIADAALIFCDQIGRKKTLASLTVLRCTLHKMAFRSKGLDSFKYMLTTASYRIGRRVFHALLNIARMAVSSLMRWQLGIFQIRSLYWAIHLGQPFSVRIVSPESHQLLVELPVAVLEIGFSPRGTFLSTLERYVKNEDGTQNKNLRVWNAETGIELASFSQRASDGW